MLRQNAHTEDVNKDNLTARDNLKARLEAVVDQACGLAKGDDDTRRFVAEQLAGAARKGVTHLDELSLLARRACSTYANRKSN